MSRLFTIGHSIHHLSYFLNLLNKKQIQCVIDVRSVPFSKYAPQYNQRDLKIFLEQNKILYLPMSEEFGARRDDKSLFDPKGFLSFDKVQQSLIFRQGINRVKDGLQKGHNICFMCTEKDPIDCHRSILIADAFQQDGYEVWNIHEDGRIETQIQLEERLLNMYYPNHKQRTIMDLIEGEESKEQLVRKAYKRRNVDIGYRENVQDEVRIV